MTKLSDPPKPFPPSGEFGYITYDALGLLLPGDSCKARDAVAEENGGVIVECVCGVRAPIARGQSVLCGRWPRSIS